MRRDVFKITYVTFSEGMSSCDFCFSLELKVNRTDDKICVCNDLYIYNKIFCFLLFWVGGSVFSGTLVVFENLVSNFMQFKFHINASALHMYRSCKCKTLWNLLLQTGKKPYKDTSNVS